MAENEKTIMLVCAAGMSTSMLVRKMLDAAEQTDVHAPVYNSSATP